MQELNADFEKIINQTVDNRVKQRLETEFNKRVDEKLKLKIPKDATVPPGIIAIRCAGEWKYAAEECKSHREYDEWVRWNTINYTADIVKVTQSGTEWVADERVSLYNSREKMLIKSFHWNKDIQQWECKMIEKGDTMYRLTNLIKTSTPTPNEEILYKNNEIKMLRNTIEQMSTKTRPTGYTREEVITLVEQITRGGWSQHQGSWFDKTPVGNPRRRIYRSTDDLLKSYGF